MTADPFDGSSPTGVPPEGAIGSSAGDSAGRGRAVDPGESSAALERQLFRLLPIPTWVIDRETSRFLAVNEAAVVRYGYTREEFLSRLTARDIREPDQWTGLHASLGDHTLPSDRGTFVHRTRTGEALEVQISSHDLDFEGRRAWLVVARDVTAERRSQREAEQQRQLAEAARDEVESLNVELRRAVTELEAVLHVAPIGIGIARDSACDEIRVNPAFAGQLGIRPSDDASKSGPHGATLPFRVMQDGVEVPGDALIMQRAARERRALVDQEYDIVHADGRTVHLLEYAAPLIDAAGAVQGAVGIFVDITERTRLVAAERAARQASEDANRVKRDFLATMSHELRTPLNAIQGHVQLLELGIHGPLADAQREALGRVNRAQRHLLTIINDVLNYARLESGRLEYHMQPTDLREVVAAVAPMIMPQFAASGVTLEVRLGDDIGLGEPVWADRDKLAQVLLNLLSNAVKFTPRGGHVTVEVASREDGTTPPDVTYVRVTDNGMGVPEDKLEAVFEPFVQANARLTRTEQGVGLGLAISRDLARGMGGDLRARSSLGAGATFTVELRRVSADGSGAAGEPTGALDGDSSPPPPGLPHDQRFGF